MVTGQIIFRDPEAETSDGRKLIMFVGVIAVPKDWPFKGERQYALAGSGDNIALDLLSEIDRTAEAKGVPIGSLVCKPIWRY